LEVEIVNSGKTPARHVEEWGKYNFSRISQLGPLPTHLIDLKWVPEGSVPPQGHQTINLEVPWNTWKQYEAPVKFRTTYASFFGEISYDDVGDKSHRTQFCFYMSDPDLHTLWFCDQWNDMN